MEGSKHNSEWSRPDLRAPGGGEDQQLDRLAFLRKVRALAPECLRDLYDRALELEPAKLNSGTAPPTPDEARITESWGEEWKLTDDWLLKTALRTIRVYARPDEHRKSRESAWRIYDLNPDLGSPPPHDREDTEPPYTTLSWYGVPRAELYPTLESVRESGLFRVPTEPFQFTGYDPTIDDAADAKKRALQQFEAYMELERKRALARGASKPSRKRARLGDETLHFEWLVRWQVLDKTYEDIRKDPGQGLDPLSPGSHAVGRAVRELCRQIGLTPKSEI